MRVHLILHLVLLIFVCSCAKESVDIPNKPKDTSIDTVSSALETNVGSSFSRLLSPEISPQEMTEGVEIINRVGMNLYRQLAVSPSHLDKNIAFSPVAVTIPWAIFYEATQGDTQQQIGDILQFTLPKETMHAVFNALDLDLLNSAENSLNVDYELNHSLWIQNGYLVQQNFFDTMITHYEMGMQLVDFAGRAGLSRTIMNKWGNRVSRQLLPDLIPEGFIIPETRFVQLSVLYFDAQWEQEFSPSNTLAKPFYKLDGSEIMVDTMFVSYPYYFVEGVNYNAIEIFLFDQQFSMWFIVPDEGAFTSVEKTLDLAMISKMKTEKVPQGVNLSLPKFSFRRDYDLKELLIETGLVLPFSPSLADFSAMSTTQGSGNLFVNSQGHVMSIDVNETGVTAVAATRTGIIETAASTVDLNINRPFIFFIEDHKQQSILFMGRVLDPAA